MLAWFLAAATASASLPVPVEPKGNPAAWVRASDLPAIDRNAAATTLDLMVDASGRPVDCNIVVPSGFGELDVAVCKALIKRARFHPAKDAVGEKTAAAYRERIVWLPTAGGSNFWFKAPDIVVTTPDITGQLKDVAEVVVVSDANDTPPVCSISKSVGIAKLDELACSVAIEPGVSPPVTNQGAIVRGVRLVRLGFEVGDAVRVRVR